MLFLLLTQRDTEMLPLLKVGSVIMLADEGLCTKILVVSHWEN